MSLFDSGSSPHERRHRVIDRTQRRLKALLRGSSVRAELAWHRLVHGAVLVRGPLTSRHVVEVLGVLLAAVAATAAAFLGGLAQEAAYMTGIFVAAALLWMMEALSLFATALLVVGLEIVLRLFQGQPGLVMLGLMTVTALFSMWMNNTASTAMMITLVTPMVQQVPEGDPVRKEFVLAVLVLTVGLWLTDRWHGLPTAVVALLPAIAFTATGVLDQTDIDSLEWNILILIGGGIALGAGIQMTGLDQIVVNAVPLEGASVGIGLVAATVVVSTFMSNTAAANLLIPIGVSFATQMLAGGGTGPFQIGLSIALAASLSMGLPVSTPPNAIAYASGELETRDFVRAGGLIGLLGIVLILAFGGPVIAFWMG